MINKFIYIPLPTTVIPFNLLLTTRVQKNEKNKFSYFRFFTYLLGVFKSRDR